MFPIVEKLGGWVEVDRILAEREITYGKESRKKWMYRQRRLPRDIALALAAEANERKIEFTESDFSMPEKEAA